MSHRIHLHPKALERLRVRSGRTATSVLHDVGLSPEEFRELLANQSFTREHLGGFARALRCTSREVLTASAVHLTKDALREEGRRSA